MTAHPKRKKVRVVSAEEYENVYQQRESMLDSMPGGSQGAKPDMDDLEVNDFLKSSKGVR